MAGLPNRAPEVSAVTISSGGYAPYWTARTHLDYADLLREVGRTDEATGFVDQALQTAKEFGFAALESRATEFLA